MRTRSKKLGRTQKLSEIAGTRTITKEQWLNVLAVFKAQREKDLERRKAMTERQAR